MKKLFTIYLRNLNFYNFHFVSEIQKLKNRNYLQGIKQFSPL